jgi:hypothetical protein
LGVPRQWTVPHHVDGRFSDLVAADTLLNVRDEAVYVVDGYGDVLYWSEAAARLYGWVGEQVVGVSAAGLLHANQRAAWDAALQCAWQDGVWSGVLGQCRVDGCTLQVSCRLHRLGQAPNAGGCVVVSAAPQAPPEALSQPLLEAERSHVLLVLVAGIAHDLNNSLLLIQLTSRLLRDSRPRPDALADTLEEAVNQSVEQAQQLMRLAMGDSGPGSAVIVPQVVHGVAEMARSGLQWPGGILGNYSAHLPVAEGSSVDLFRVLLALLVGASRHLDRDAAIEIAATAEEQSVKVVVAGQVAAGATMDDGDLYLLVVEPLVRKNGWELHRENTGGRQTWCLGLPVAAAAGRGPCAPDGPRPPRAA